MLRTIADSGPLIALFEPAERNHARVRSFIENYEGALLTTWPVLTEVGHMLGHSVDRQLAFLQWVERGGVEVTTPGAGAVSLIRQLSEKYRDLPMDIADGSLIVLALESGVRDILTLDRDFDVYRLPDRSRFNNVLATT
ncbi:MAG TPA: PIN domain-containing protein [Thauera sp.]|uniref:type II toxin-antitoxin system VapC family toxin n=1 Tax=Thauera sp. TaxID=1905334 RepID=UPI000FB86CBC|nr:PIN domain-containing protein [Thauera sp.]MCP5224167.1 PIN domain-containing protein [Thauera sp.]RTL29067.1 MAG: PIN domain-containing protein [Rhodocyclaceae bacterium]HPE03675.1 PIN domain-containing protein [Thauera sp.]HRV78679.1 PIN domain-containing protein [Thauera sp.]